MQFLRFIFLNIVLIFAVDATAKIQRHSPSGRIIGGELARAGQFPWAAAIYKYTVDGTYFCGGALINRWWVLTAAHCVANATNFIIQLGSDHLQGSDPYRLTVATDFYVIYNQYDPITLENDIGMIKFRGEIELSDYIQPINWVSENDFDVTAPAIALGWGQTTDESPGLTDSLMFVELAGISNLECQTVFGDVIKDTMICADGNYNQGFCNGDNGGPLVQLAGFEQYVIVGIASFISTNGCESTDPSGYTRIYSFQDYITAITQNV